jgi:putative DNA primase/helicase
LPYPKADNHGLANLDKLLSNLPPDDRILCKSFLLGCFHPTGSYPTLVLVGQQGTGKSTVANIIIGLIDPSEQGCATLPHGDRNMMIAASKSWLPAFDNISVLNASQQDLFCRLNTGTGWRHRALRTDDQELIIKVKRPVLLNSINDGIVTRPDLADRSLLVHCNVITEVQRRLETSSVMGGDKEVGIMDEFNQHKAGILGTILTAVAAALRKQNTVKLKSKPRMADFVRWVVAGAEPLGMTDFQVAYARSRASLVENSLEAAPIYPALVTLIIKQKKVWHDSMFTLYDQLVTYNDHSPHPIRDFPRNTRDLREHLNRLAPSLRAINVLVTFDNKLENGTRRRMVKIDPSHAS